MAQIDEAGTRFVNSNGIVLLTDSFLAWLAQRPNMKQGMDILDLSRQRIEQTRCCISEESKNKGKELINIGGKDAWRFVALHFQGSLEESVWRDKGVETDAPEHWKILKAELLARDLDDLNKFPFCWFANLSKGERLLWTFLNFLMVTKISIHGFQTSFNVQRCDQSAFKQLLARMDPMSNWAPRNCVQEWAEFKETQVNGSIGMKDNKDECICPEQLKDIKGLCVIDDCGTYPHSFADVVQTLEADSEQKIQGVKLDILPCSIAFNGVVPNPMCPKPTEEEIEENRSAIQDFVSEIKRKRPGISICVEATVLKRQKLELVPALDPSKCTQQGMHATSQALPVAVADEDYDKLHRLLVEAQKIIDGILAEQ